jgi:hypothetical protein
MSKANKDRNNGQDSIQLTSHIVSPVILSPEGKKDLQEVAKNYQK